MKPTMVADEMFPEGPPYTDVEEAGETNVFQQVHSEDFYRGYSIFGQLSGSGVLISIITHLQGLRISMMRTTLTRIFS